MDFGLKEWNKFKSCEEDIQLHFDLDSMYLENTTYVDEQLNKHFSDLVLSVS